jgi:hypothetical protein
VYQLLSVEQGPCFCVDREAGCIGWSLETREICGCARTWRRHFGSAERQRLWLFSTSTTSVEFASNLASSATKPTSFFDSNRRLVRCMCQELRHARCKMKRLCRKVSYPAPPCSLWCEYCLSCGLWSQMHCTNVYACRKIMVSASNFFCLS